MSYQFKPDIKSITYPPRIQEIVDEYTKHGFEYTGPNPDNDMESWKEMGYEKRVKGRPDTAYTIVKSIYRILDEIANEEFMIWKEIKWVKDRDEKDYHFDVVMGRRPRFDVIPITDEDGNEIDKRINKWNMVYTTKWDPKKVDELINKSKTKRTEFYLTYASPDYYTVFTGKVTRVRELDKFKSMSFNDLIAYDKSLEMNMKMQLAKSGK